MPHSFFQMVFSYSATVSGVLNMVKLSLVTPCPALDVVAHASVSVITL